MQRTDLRPSKADHSAGFVFLDVGKGTSPRIQNASEAPIEVGGDWRPMIKQRVSEPATGGKIEIVS